MEYQQVLLILMITELGGTLKTHILLLSVFSLFACACLLDLGFLPDLGCLLHGKVFGLHMWRFQAALYDKLKIWQLK